MVIKDILDTHCHFKSWDNDNIRPVYDQSGAPIVTSNGSPTDLSGHTIECGSPNRWTYGGAYSSGIAWIERYMLNWGDGQIRGNTP